MSKRIKRHESRHCSSPAMVIRLLGSDEECVDLDDSERQHPFFEWLEMLNDLYEEDGE